MSAWIASASVVAPPEAPTPFASDVYERQAVTFPVPAGWGSTVTAIRFAVGETPYVTTVEGGATPEKPVVSAITVGDATVTVTISNAKAGLYYGLLSASTLEGLKPAEPVWQTEPAASEGTFDIPAGDRGTSGFYRVLVKRCRT